MSQRIAKKSPSVSKRVREDEEVPQPTETRETENTVVPAKPLADKTMADEPLCQDNPNRFVLFPIKYHDIWKKYKEAESSIWTTEEIDLSADTKDWESLDSDDQHLIKHVLAFSAASDRIVLEKLAQRFMNDIKIPEARCFYGFQIAVENIHFETYSYLIDTYIKDSAEKAHLFNTIENIPAVAKKAKWALRWTGSQATFAERLIAFAAVEGIFFSGSFWAMFWLRKRSLMPGFTFSTELILRDRSLHCDFACLLYEKHIKNRLSQERVEFIIKEAVSIEKEFITEAVSKCMGGNYLMAMSVEFCADRLIAALGHDKVWNAKNPVDFIEMSEKEIGPLVSEHSRLQLELARMKAMDRDRARVLEFSKLQLELARLKAGQYDAKEEGMVSTGTEQDEVARGEHELAVPKLQMEKRAHDQTEKERDRAYELELAQLNAGQDDAEKKERKVSAVAFSADGTMLATRSCDNIVRAWDVETGMPLLKWDTEPERRTKEGGSTKK